VSETGVIALNHVGVSVADLDRARAFWIDELGGHDHGAFAWPVGTAPADESLATEDTSAEVALLRTDAAFLELFAFSSPTPAPRRPGTPGVAALRWAVRDGRRGLVHCPDGTPVELVAAGDGPSGLVGVVVRVSDPAVHALPAVPGPVDVTVVDGADGADAPAARPVDLGVNHLCVDVSGIADVRASLQDVRWHHGVTESSGGIAAVCYGTTADGVLVELLESRSPEAFLSRCRLTYKD
jgi:catechol 2,3-dioxygenase-like lactoylglutathione lyase family enzyme